MSTPVTLVPLGAVCVEQADVSAVPDHDAWLTPAERLWLSERHVPKRRADWRLGRWVGKGAVACALDAPDLPPDQVEILPEPGGAPTARVRSGVGWAEVSLSLSHAAGIGFAAALPGRVRLGCDVEAIEPRSDHFVDDYFTHDEAVWARSGGAEVDLRATLIWSAKESALKALGEGLRLDTRSVEVRGETPPRDGSWGAMTVRGPAGVTLTGCWRRTPGFVWTIALEEARWW